MSLNVTCCPPSGDNGERIESFNTLCNNTAPVFNRGKINELVADCSCTSKLMIYFCYSHYFHGYISIY